MIEVRLQMISMYCITPTFSPTLTAAKESTSIVRAFNGGNSR